MAGPFDNAPGMVAPDASYAPAPAPLASMPEPAEPLASVAPPPPPAPIGSPEAIAALRAMALAPNPHLPPRPNSPESLAITKAYVDRAAPPGAPPDTFGVLPPPPGQTAPGAPPEGPGGAISFGRPVSVDGRAGTAPTADTRKPVAAGGVSNPDPFGDKAATKALLGTYDTEAEATGRGARAEQARVLMAADARANLAREQQEDAAIARAEAEEARRHYDENVQRIQDQIDALSEKKIDPLRGMHDKGMGIMGVVGGLFGDLYHGITGREAPFITNLDKVINRNIALQEKELERQRAGIGQSMNLLGQQHAVFKDMSLAKLQARNLYYEATKQDIEAQAARDQIPEMQARADLGVNLINRQQDLLKREIAGQLRAQAMAQAAQARAELERARKAGLEEREMRVKEVGAVTEAKKADAEIAKSQGKDDDEARKDIADKLSDPKFVEAKATIDAIVPRLLNEKGEIDNDKGVPGVGRGADIRNSWLFTSPVGGKGNSPLGLSDEERMGRQEWDRLRLAYQTAVTGAGGSDEQMAQITQAFSGAQTPAEQANAVRLAQRTLREREEAVKAQNPRAAAQYDKNKAQIRAGEQNPVPRFPVK